MSPSVLCPSAIAPAITPAAAPPRRLPSTTPAPPGNRLDVLLDAWPCPTDADAHLRAVATAWTTDAGRTWRVDAIAEPVVSAEDGAAAVALGARLRHVGSIDRCADGVRAWRGIAAVPAGHLLASVPEGQWAAVVGAGSGHEVLVAAPVASAVDAVALVARAAGAWPTRPGAAPFVDARTPATAGRSWLLRLRFAHAVPAPAFVESLLAGVGLHVGQLRLAAASSPDTVCWAAVSAPGQAVVAPAIAALHRVHRVAGHAWPVL